MSNKGKSNDRFISAGKLRNLISSQHTKAFLIIFFVLAAVYLIPFAIHRSQNPILQRAGVASSLEPGILSGQNTIDPNDGFTSQALGHRAAESWLSGEAPYWNHYEGAGMPLAAGMQSAAFFPPVLLMHFYNGFIIFHFLLQLTAGITAYLFFRKMKARFSIAVVGGILFALSSTFVWLTNAAFNPVAFLPMLLLGIECAFTQAENKKRGGWILIALALGLSLYAGFPETAFINAIFAYGWGAVRLFHIDKKARKKYITKLLIGSAVGVMLAAPILVAFLGYLPETIVGGHKSSAYANFALPLKTLPALFMPYIYGPIFGAIDAGKTQTLLIFWSNVGGYLAMPLLFVGSFGLFSKRPRSMKLYLAIFSLVVILKNYGFKPIVLLVNAIPGMSQVAFYRYSMPVLDFAVIVLAVFGVEAFVKLTISRKKVIALTILASLATIGLAVYSRSLLHQLSAFPSHRLWAALSVSWALSSAGFIILCFLKPKLRLAGALLLLTADSLLMFSIPYLSLPKIKNDYRPVNYLQQNIGLDRFYTLGPISPNYGSYFGIASVNINDLPLPKKWAEYIPAKLDNNATALVFTGNSRVDPAGPSSLEEFSKNINEFENVGGRYLVANHNQVSDEVKNGLGLNAAFSSATVDIFRLPDTKPYFDNSAGCQLIYTSWDKVDANCNKQAVILRRELSMPGWSATINQQKQPVKSDNGIFQTVDVPAGKSSVVFRYAPPHIEIGYAVFAVGILIILGQAFGYKLISKK
ncbi:MAG TPA: hypothetical protein VLE74_02260 [Candidatus Saccharimonadales bacterium]|nr:hypothetical protein [Candidatus Saccharimonadales bacterium]